MKCSAYPLAEDGYAALKLCPRGVQRCSSLAKSPNCNWWAEAPAIRWHSRLLPGCDLPRNRAFPGQDQKTAAEDGPQCQCRFDTPRALIRDRDQPGAQGRGNRPHGRHVH